MNRNLSLAIVILVAVSGLSLVLMKTAGQAEPGLVRGRVVSPYGPVDNARVRLPGEQEFALTDRDGWFSLRTGHRPGSRVRVSAGKEGWFNNAVVGYSGSGMRDIHLNPIYLNDRAEYQFVSPVTCSRCHTKLAQYWDKSKMAHTTSNPKVHDLFYGTDALKREGVEPGYRLDNPASNGDCAACHAPAAAAASPWSVDLRAALQSPRSEWDGISCDYCHKVRKIVPDPNKPSGMAAVLERQSSLRSPSILVFGPYDDVVVGPMAASYNSVYDDARFCSTCHSHAVKLDDRKAWDYQRVYSSEEWEGFGFADGRQLPIQTTFQEWKQWQAALPTGDPNKGKKCQTCHMSWRKEMLPYDNYVVDGMARHMWATYRSPQDIRPHHFDGGTETQLKTALALELDGQITGNRLRLTVYITNTNGGHWVPTGETMRSIMLLVKAQDSSGRPLELVAGGRLPAWAGQGNEENGDYAGLPGAVFARILRDEAGQLHAPFWRASAIEADTRIRPKGTVELDFEFELTDPNDEPTAEARLIYRPVVRLLAIQKKWTVEDILITSRAW